MGERTYRAACALYRLFSRKMNVEWAEPFQKGPCVFVVNNAGVAGALDMMVRFPEKERIHPWILEEMLEKREYPIPPAILKGTPYIPVYRDQRFILTLRQSIRVLQKDHYLLIFPEQTPGGRETHRWINTGWLRLGEMWYRASGRSLKMYPVHVDKDKHLIKVAAPVRYDPAKRFSEQEKDLVEQLSKGLRGES